MMDVSLNKEISILQVLPIRTGPDSPPWRRSAFSECFCFVTVVYFLFCDFDALYLVCDHQPGLEKTSFFSEKNIRFLVLGFRCLGF